MLNQKRLQLSLPMPEGETNRGPSSRRSPLRMIQTAQAPMDQLLSTRDVVRTTGRHRCTIYRWVRDGVFPPKRAGGGRGWLRSDVERWLLNGRVAAETTDRSQRV